VITFVLGGAKSGKTKWSLVYAETLKGFKNYYYLATAEPLDEEMRQKIEKHRHERKPFWKVIEEPLEVAKVLENLKNTSSLILIDCLSLWVSNLLHYKKPFEEEMNKLLESLEKFKGERSDWIILVSNEVGLGIVPESKMARLYREYLGFLNQKVASLSDEAFLIVAGISLNLKTRAEEIIT